ncbi:MAG: flavodoxin family protein, partial [Candidatus Aminicenantales bacterium]
FKNAITLLTGNTKKIAEAIYKALKAEKVIKPVAEVQEIDPYSLIFIGFPVHSHSVPIKVGKLLKRIPRGKKIALFSTHGSHTGSRLSREALEHAVVLAPKAKVLGTFSCRGKVSSNALEILSKSPEHAAWAEMALSARTHPDEDDLEDVRAFTQWIMTLFFQKYR